MMQVTTFREGLNALNVYVDNSKTEGMDITEEIRAKFTWIADNCDAWTFLGRVVMVLAGATAGGCLVSALSSAFQGDAGSFAASTVFFALFGAITNDLYRYTTSSDLASIAFRRFNNGLQESKVLKAGNFLDGAARVLNKAAAAGNNLKAMRPDQEVQSMTLDKKEAAEIKVLVTQIFRHCEAVFIPLNLLDCKIPEVQAQNQRPDSASPATAGRGRGTRRKK